MGAINTALYGFGASQASAPTAEDIATFRQMVPALNLPGIDLILRTPVESVDLEAVADASASSTSDTTVWSPKYPIKIINAEFVCNTAAGATGTADLQTKPSGGSFGSILSAVVDVKTGAGTWQPGVVVDTDDEHLVETTGQIKAVFSSGSGGALAGGKVRVYFVRQSPTDAS